MSSAFTVIGVAVDLWWRNWVSLAAINLAWALCWLSIVLGPPATLAAYQVAANLARGEDGGLSDFLQALRTNFLVAWAWFASNLVVLFVLAVSLLFYAQFTTLWGVWLWTLTFLLGALWLAVQFYTLPYLLESRDKRLLQAYRNALLTVLASPFYTLVLLGVTFLVATVSVLLVALLFLGGPCLIAVLASAAVQDRLRTYGVLERRQDSA